MNGQQLRAIFLSVVLNVNGTPGMPTGIPNLPPKLELEAKGYKPALQDLFDSHQAKQVKALVRQPMANFFKGGPKKVSLPRVGLFDASQIGFWFFDLVGILDIAAKLNQDIFGNYAGFVDNAPLESHYKYHADRMQIPYPDLFRQGETTQDAKERVLKEAMQCCKAITEAAAIQLRSLNTTMQEFTYKSSDSAPRYTKKKRTRL